MLDVRVSKFPVAAWKRSLRVGQIPGEDYVSHVILYSEGGDEIVVVYNSGECKWKTHAFYAGKQPEILEEIRSGEGVAIGNPALCRIRLNAPNEFLIPFPSLTKK